MQAFLGIFDIYLLEAVINGILLGGVLALLALVRNLTFGGIDVTWICYAELVMIGMYAMYFIVQYYGLSYFIAAPFTILLVAILGAALHYLVIAPLLTAPRRAPFTNALPPVKAGAIAPPTAPPIAASATPFQLNSSWIPVATPTAWLATLPAAPAAAAPNFHLLGTSGTVTTVAGVHLGLPRYERSRVDGCWLDITEVRAVTAGLLEGAPEIRSVRAATTTPAISSWTANTSAAGRSNVSDHEVKPVRPSMSSAATRTRSPARRTLPSSR